MGFGTIGKIGPVPSILCFRLIDNCLVLWHFAPIMTEEQQRSFIGNNNAVIFFKDEGEAFNPSLVGNMGAMPQVFLVVQPFKGQYRLMTSSNVRFRPNVSQDWVL